MGNNIIIDSQELHDLACEIDTLIYNNDFLINAIHALRINIIEQELYGVEKDMLDKLEQYEDYFANYYMQMLGRIQDNIGSVGSTFDEQDIENKKGLL